VCPPQLHAEQVTSFAFQTLRRVRFPESGTWARSSCPELSRIGVEKMLGKCINPQCSETFRYLGSGRLFRLENYHGGAPTRFSTPEYFWLCRNCSGKLTLRLDETNGIKIMQFRETGVCESDSFLFVPLDRRNGLLLNEIRFTAGRVRRHARASQGGQIHI